MGLNRTWDRKTHAGGERHEQVGGLAREDSGEEAEWASGRGAASPCSGGY